MLFVIATNRSGGGPGSIFLFTPNTIPPLNSLSWRSSLLLLLTLVSPVCVPCTISPVEPVSVLGKGEDPSPPLKDECRSNFM